MVSIGSSTFGFKNLDLRQPSVNMFPTDEKTDLFTNSDLNLLAAKKFDHVLRQIQESSLNFQMTLSPFSAMISLKKSFVTDTTGAPLLPLKVSAEADEKNLVAKLEMENKRLQLMYDELVSRHETAISSINSLENAVQDREDSLVKLEHVNKSAKESAVKLNKILNDTRVKFEHEKEFLKRGCKPIQTPCCKIHLKSENRGFS